jgi:hypothetical protein
MTAQTILNEICWYEQKLKALESENLTIKLVVDQTSIMSIGATVENESLQGVLAVEFVGKVQKDLKTKIALLRKELAVLSVSEDAGSTYTSNYTFNKHQRISLKGVFNNIMNFFL